MNLFVFPVNPDVELAPEFERFATIPSDPLRLDPALIDANRADWIDRWTAIVSS
jgi:thiamine transport system substrate-binding protein